MEQMSLFDGSKKFVVDKPIRLISLFSGYDSQEFALKYLGVEYEHYKTCEWAVKSIQALKDAHYGNDNTDYSANHSQEFIIHQLYKWGISANYNEPMTKEQIKRLGEQKQRQTYNNIKATHNLVNIQQVTADRLEIIDRDKYCYLMTYSFPCQDLSKAGKGKGMAKDSGTRSGMLWEVERILDECTENLPQILLMENVPDVIGSKNIEHFAKWLEKLESLGYKCYWRVLNAKDYGIPQNRERCFMISLLGDYYYEFPQPIKLEHRLKDLLEDNVDEKYYLSDKILSKINIEDENIQEKIGIDLNSKISKTRDIANTIKARYDCGYENFTPGPTGVIEPRLMELTKNERQANRIYDSDGLSISLCANGGGLGAKTGLYKVEDTEPKCIGGIGDKNSNNGTQWHQQDRIYDNNIAISVTTGFNPYYVSKEQNLKTQLCNELIASGKVKENDVIRHSYSTSRMNGQMKDIQQNNMCPTLDTRCDCLGVVLKDNNICNLFFTIFDLCAKISNKEIEKYERSRDLLSILWKEITKKEIWEKIGRFWGIQKEKILQQNLYENGIFENRQFQSRISKCSSNSKKYIQDNSTSKKMFDMWEEWKTRYSPHRWELSEQQFKQFNLFMSKLSYEGTSEETSMQDMWETDERFRVLRETLSKIQEIWRPTIYKEQSFRIRKLCPIEVFRLMGVKDEDFEKIAQNQSNASLYHLAGDSIVVNVLMAIFSKLFKKE